MFTWFLRVLEAVSFCGHMCFPLCQKLRKVWLVESQVERFLSVRSDRNIAALWSTSRAEIFLSILTNQVVAVILLFSRISLMCGIRETNRKW